MPKSKNNLKYSSVHVWLMRNYGKAHFCAINKDHKSKRFDWANISGEYKKDPSDFIPLCLRCHYLLDKKLHSLEKLIEVNKYVIINYGKSSR